MDSTTVITWLARALLLIIIIGLIYVFTTRKNKYDYIGITNPIKRDVLYDLDRTFSTGRSKSPKKHRENKTENMCRRIVQEIYGMPFPSIRPDFLRSPVTKKNLELDCYNAQLKIAIEYNGKQHYTYTPHFHGSKTNFYSQVHRDDWKRKKCREMGIRLIEIPYWVSPPDLKEYITRELRKQNCLP